MNKVSTTVALVLVAIVSFSAEASEPPTMDVRVQQLEEANRALEARVAALEAQLLGQNSGSGMGPDKASWRRLKRGMSEAEVEALLGSPSQAEMLYSGLVWYYGERPMGGNVSFDRKGELETWEEPR